jgi:hypothetical protein
VGAVAWLKRFFGGTQDSEREERRAAAPVEAGIAEVPTDVVEIEVVGEASYHANAIRVEAMGTLVGYVPRRLAAQVAPVLGAHRGVAECQGLIVGGWRTREDEGHYGIRVWFTRSDADRLGLSATLVPSPVPTLPPAGPNEVRLSPAEGDYDNARVTTVTVTREEHYQPAILASKPSPDWNRDWWPALARLELVDADPHAKNPAPCVAVKLGDQVVGYLTPAMTERHTPVIDGVVRAGRTPTASAQVGRGTKGGQQIWRVKLLLRA